MNESQSTQAINRKVRDAGVYALKIQLLMNNGIPDCWYSGNKQDLWIEHKYISTVRMPKKDTTAINSMLSELQSDWLKKRHQEGRNVAVVIGSKSGYCVQSVPLIWNSPIFKNDLTLTRTQVVKWIINKTNG